MDYLRPEHDDDTALEEDLSPDLDGDVIDRLSAYGNEAATTNAEEPSRDEGHVRGDVPSWSGEPPAEPPALSFGAESETMEDAAADPSDAADAEDEDADADVDEPEPVVVEAVTEEIEVRAVDEGHAADPVDDALAEQDEPEAVDAASGDSSSGKKGRPSFRLRRGGGERSDEPSSPKAENSKEKKAKDKRAHDKKAKRLVGLKIGASQIAAAQVVNNGAPELVDVYREPLEAGLVVSGEIRDPDALGAALKRFFELHKLPKRGVRLGLSNNRIGVRMFEIEGVTDPQQLENAIRFRAEEVLPIPLDQAVLDYAVLEDAEREDGTPTKRILLVVAYREVVDRYLQACRSAGLEVVGIDLEAFALLRSLEAPADREPDAGALVAAAIGHDRTTIAVSTGRLCEFTRVLDWGGWSLNVAIARELDRAPSEVEAIKRQLSLSGETVVEGLTPEQAAKARDGVQRALAAFARELVASLQFYQAQPGALGIGEVVLTGGTAHMDGLPDALGSLVGVPIRLGDPFKRIKVSPKVEFDGQRGSIAIAIGLGIED